jgi:hypothetical protein
VLEEAAGQLLEELAILADMPLVEERMEQLDSHMAVLPDSMEDKPSEDMLHIQADRLVLVASCRY